jgi:hypothetical protein
MEDGTQVESIETLPLEEPEDGVYETYANMVEADWTLTEVRLRFLHLLHVTSGDKPTNQNREAILLERACISLPWWQAKVMKEMLDGLIRSYESVNGELQKPMLAPRPELKKPA